MMKKLLITILLVLYSFSLVLAESNFSAFSYEADVESQKQNSLILFGNALLEIDGVTINADKIKIDKADEDSIIQIYAESNPYIYLNYSSMSFFAKSLLLVENTSNTDGGKCIVLRDAIFEYPYRVNQHKNNSILSSVEEEFTRGESSEMIISFAEHRLTLKGNAKITSKDKAISATTITYDIKHFQIISFVR